MSFASPSSADAAALTGQTIGTSHRCDVLVVGGGINGCGIARDLAGLGWQVLLAEQDGRDAVVIAREDES